VTRELEQATPEAASVIIGRLMGESAAKGLDAAVFDSVAADSTRPAGLLYGVSALPATATGGAAIDVAAADIAVLAGAFSAAGVNSANMVLVLHPKQAWRLRMILGYQTLDVLILMSIALAPGTIIAAVPEAVASGYEGQSEIDVVQHPTLHFDDSVPLALVGLSGTPAQPAMSTFQQDLLAVKLKVRCAWAALQPGCIQYITGVNW
jgi:hypothetical protein